MVKSLKIKLHLIKNNNKFLANDVRRFQANAASHENQN